MKTLVKIVKLIDGTEHWFRLEGAVPTYEIVFLPKAVRS